jgi:hypothetical protein
MAKVLTEDEARRIASNIAKAKRVFADRHPPQRRISTSS